MKEDPSPCLECTWRPLCKQELFACKSYNSFVRTGKTFNTESSYIPSRKWYAKIYWGNDHNREV